MLLILSEISMLSSVFKLVLLLFVFFLLLYGAHLFTKWYAKSNYVNTKSNNIAIIESQQISPGKSIIIAKIGKKYVSFVLTKENATLLSEIEENDLILEKPKMQTVSFREIMKKMKDKNEKKNN